MSVTAWLSVASRSPRLAPSATTARRRTGTGDAGMARALASIRPRGKRAASPVPAPTDRPRHVGVGQPDVGQHPLVLLLQERDLPAQPVFAGQRAGQGAERHPDDHPRGRGGSAALPLPCSSSILSSGPGTVGRPWQENRRELFRSDVATDLPGFSRGAERRSSRAPPAARRAGPTGRATSGRSSRCSSRRAACAPIS